jgi:hypothetical protein
MSKKPLILFFYLLLLLVNSCTHTYDSIATKRSNCLRYNAEKNILEFVCAEKEMGYSPILTISATMARLDTIGKISHARLLESTRLFYYTGDNRLPYQITQQSLDTLDYLNFIVRYQKKKFELSLYKGFKKDSLYYFLEH